MYQGLLVIDADAHKLENPLVLRDYIEPEYRDRIGLVIDSLGDQRARIVDFNPATGKNDFMRMFPQPQGLGKGGFRNLHPDTTLGAMFNKVRLEHMDQEGIDVQAIYGTLNLTFSSIIDKDLAIALCRAYNNYMADDCRGYDNRLKPIGVLPLQDVDAAIAEMHRCVNELGMIGIAVAPHLPIPHPKAPDAFPDIRTCKALSHPDFRPLLQAAVDLDIAIGIHGGPGDYLVGGIADHTETFVLTHIFVQRNQQQLALARMIFDGAFEQFPTLRVGFLEGGCGWVPDLAHAFHEHWEKRIRDFDPKNTYRPSLMEFTKLMIQERGGSNNINIISKAKTSSICYGMRNTTRQRSMTPVCTNTTTSATATLWSTLSAVKSSPHLNPMTPVRLIFTLQWVKLVSDWLASLATMVTGMVYSKTALRMRRRLLNMTGSI
jgi:predicted TIM-barrel fold metal-dependent hydrolase